MEDKGMGKSDKSRTSWLTVVLSALLAAALSFVVSYWITGHTFELNQDAQMERAAKYADKLEVKLEVELDRKWADYRQDSTRWVSDKADSLERGRGWLGRQHMSGSVGAVNDFEERVDDYFRKLIEGTRKEIIRTSEDRRLEIETIRETGVLLK
ncbi:MAG: hypothetical protein ABIJ61_14375 [bacterium]